MKLTVLSEFGMRLASMLHGPKPTSEIFEEFISEGVTVMQWSEGTVTRWRTFWKHLENFMESPADGHKRWRGSLEFCGKDLVAFVQFLSGECGFRNSTVDKELSMLRWFLRWACGKGYARSRDFEDFHPKIKTARRTVIYLTTEELMRLYRLDIPAETPQYEQMSLTRDIFCFCCFTSLRFSDAVRLKMSNIQGGRIILTTQKTNDALSIELNPYADSVIAKYASEPFGRQTLFPHIAMSTVNIHIKQLGRMCGIDEPVVRTWFAGRDRVDETLPKWQCLSTHAARRTFICSALSAGINAETIMKWTGHSSYKAMKPYIDVTDKDKAKAMDKLFRACGGLLAGEKYVCAENQ